jgi:23S rRNA pseudouridine2605 synthase
MSSRGGAGRSGAGRSGTGRSGTGRSGTGRSGAGRSSSGRGGAGRGARREGASQRPARPRAKEPRATEPRAKEPRAKEPRAKDPRAKEPRQRGLARNDREPGRQSPEADTVTGIRLQRALAEAGVGSRRHCEELIAAGRVMVDGTTVTWFGMRVDPMTAVIHVDGKRIPTRPELRYIALNKPRGVVSTMTDPYGRSTLADYVADLSERLFHVGRLDTDTEGLILLTNDGELAHRLIHPSYGVAKTYLAEVTGSVPKDLGRRLREGLRLDDGVATVDQFRLVERAAGRALVEVTLHEGRKHIVRRLLAAAGNPVQRLVRTQVGPIRLGRLRSGTARALTVNEIGELYAAVGL